MRALSQIAKSGGVLLVASIVLAYIPHLRGVVAYSFGPAFIGYLILMPSITGLSWVVGRVFRVNWPLFRISVITAVSVLVLQGPVLLLFSTVLFDD